MSISVPRDAPERLTTAVRTTSPLTGVSAPLGVWRHRGIASTAWIVGCRRCYWWRSRESWRGAVDAGGQHLVGVHRRPGVWAVELSTEQVGRPAQRVTQPS